MNKQASEQCNMGSTSTESYAMKGGDGLYSYTQNSLFQREGAENALVLIKEGIAEKLDLEQIIISLSPSKVFTVADLGCSVGPNSVIAVQNIIECVRLKHQSLDSNNIEDDLEFQVLFNDLVSNDFNTLFKSLPPDRQYFAAGVPGRFQGRLFPKASLHFVHSSFSLHWLPNTPKELMDKNSPAFNKGRIHYNNSPKEVGEAYSAQFAMGMESFLGARAEEVVDGGLVAIVLVCMPDGIHPSRCTTSGINDLLEAALLDMVKEGLVSEEKVDSFNLPRYHPTPQELEGLIKKNPCFSIERMERIFPSKARLAMASDNALVISHVRAIWDEIFEEHFGAEIIDELFDRFSKKMVESSPFSASLKYEHMVELFVLLKRNSS
ncbi:hypothetical protein PTKIN_Ptkin12aG0045100 [Pterospermum kingtungense]